MSPQFFQTFAPNNTPVYKLSTIQAAFLQIINDYEIDFEYVQGGCQQRAQIMSMILNQDFNISHEKIWLFAPNALYFNDSRMFTFSNPFFTIKNEIIEWSYHLAPIVKVKTPENAIIHLIIDPTINNEKPLTLQEWLMPVGNSNIGKYTFTPSEYYFFNGAYNLYDETTNSFNSTFFEFVNPARDNLTMEKGLAINDMAMQVLKKYILPFINNPQVNETEKAERLYEIFGNATAVDYLFGQNMSGFTDSTTHRFVLTHYPEIMLEAKNYFNERLFYWTKVSNRLLSI